MGTETADEMRKWLESLTMSERRFLRLQVNARSGASESQQMVYYDWLNQSKAGDPLPEGAKFVQNLPTVTQRLKELVLDSLRLQHKSSTVDATLHADITDIALLRERGLIVAATRQLSRTKKLALTHGRYAAALQCLHIEQAMAVTASSKDLEQKLVHLRAEEVALLRAQEEFAELRHRHSILMARMTNLLVPRTDAALQELLGYADSSWLHRPAASPQYLERTFAWNLLAYRALVTDTAHEVLPRLAALLQEWNIHPDWQRNEPDLLYFASSFYQSLVCCVPMPERELQGYLRLLPDFDALPAEVSRNFRRMLLYRQFVITMNTGQVERLPQLMMEIDQWLARHRDALPEARVLPFLHNCLVAEFILGNLKAAKARVREIAAVPNSTVRSDIREFAHLLHAVLLFEQGDEALDEYILRSNKRHFKEVPRQVEFELIVLKYLERCMADPGAERQATAGLVADLDVLAGQVGENVPLLGLNELRLWAQARHERRPLREVFLDAVQANLAAMAEKGAG